MSTEYIILQKIATNTMEEWRPIRNAGGVEYRTARSSRAAITAALGGEVKDGTYVAVPLRSWKPVTVKVETKTALHFS